MWCEFGGRIGFLKLMGEKNLRAKIMTCVCESWRVGVDMGRSGDRFLYLEVCRVGLTGE